MEISKSSALIAKEKELKKLRTKYKKTLTQVKRTRTMLKNTQEGIEKLQRNMGTGVMQNIYDIKKLEEEIFELLKEAQHAEKVSKEDREQARMMYDDLKANGGFIPEEVLPFTMEELKEKMENRTAEFNTDDHDRQRAFEYFKQFSVEPDKEEVKDIRKIYIRLANRFHPDKAKNDAEREYFHEMMQQIITAKDRGDMATLQAIETEHLTNSESIPTQAEPSVILDAMDEQIAKVSYQILQIEKQLKRLKEELNELKDSELGEAYAHEKRMMRQNMGSTEEAADEMNEMRQHLIIIRDGVANMIKTGELTPEALAALQPQPEPDFFDMMFGMDDYDDDDDDDDFFSAFEQEQKSHQTRYDESDGRFYTADYSKAELSDMNRETEDDSIGNLFANIELPPDVEEITAKIMRGEMTQEEAQAALMEKLNKMFGR
ncbi:MAG: J domain-containing protein [Saprospiraceae bacterium]